ncbi:ferrochelatase [Paenibacillus yanchengensis]|uniref:Coproporphyrin III ferrochelatase n=1 Tax=Paenibacillus yanchengensis TaxID=2035833 RepID=A0ABW4YNR1_9BACL
MQGKIGVLVMSYGTPESLDDIETYYTHIRRGRKPSDEQLNDLTMRYEAIVGGVFPLREHTNLQVASLQDKLEQLAPGRYQCFQGLKHARPYIEDGVAAMAKAGITEAVAIVLAPHYSTMSIGSYLERAAVAAEQAGITMSGVKQYHMHPKWLQAITERVVAGVERLEKRSAEMDKTMVLFSAHSLPVRIRELDDPYEQQLLQSSEAIAQAANVKNWQFTWQSAGQTHEPWLGPDLLETMATLRDEGVTAILVAPIGFVSDHLEIMYDIDIEAQAEAKKLGITLERITMLNSDPLYMETLAESVMELK